MTSTDVQFVSCGDFYQLPPIAPEMPGRPREVEARVGYAFQSGNWPSVVAEVFQLTTVHRQTDPSEQHRFTFKCVPFLTVRSEFIKILNEIRRGEVSDHSEATLKALSRPIPDVPDGIVPACLFAKCFQTEAHNAKQLGQIGQPKFKYMSTVVHHRQAHLPETDNEPPQVVELKLGAQVMVTRNRDSVLTNGCVGAIVGFAAVEDSTLR